MTSTLVWWAGQFGGRGEARTLHRGSFAAHRRTDSDRP